MCKLGPAGQRAGRSAMERVSPLSDGQAGTPHPSPKLAADPSAQPCDVISDPRYLLNHAGRLPWVCFLEGRIPSRNSGPTVVWDSPQFSCRALYGDGNGYFAIIAGFSATGEMNRIPGRDISGALTRLDPAPAHRSSIEELGSADAEASATRSQLASGATSASCLLL